jgi:hypothetical protein
MNNGLLSMSATGIWDKQIWGGNHDAS